MTDFTPLPTDPAAVVVAFLEAIAAGEAQAAAKLLAPDARWENVSLPTVRGRDAIERVLLGLQNRGIGFRVHMHAIAVDGDVVLTERDDALRWRRVEQRFWVWGRFEVHDGVITVWRDSFDWRDSTAGLLRGLLGALHPAINRPWPSGH